jgi:hypothetical protein
MNHLKAVAVSLLISLCSAIGVANAQGGTPSSAVSATATVDLKVYALSTGQKANVSSGVLTYQGKKYPFTVKGIGLHESQIGASHLVADASVYNLNKVSDFEGTYFAIIAEMEATGKSRIRSNKNILVDLRGWSKGPVVISPEGAVIEFTK